MDISREYISMPRDEYIDLNNKLSKKLWENEPSATVSDFADMILGKDNDNLNSIIKFFDNEEELNNMANRVSAIYSPEESREFIAKVISANSSDITQAGWMYKLLMASADTTRIVSDDCGSDGREFKLDDITEDAYNYYVYNMWVHEYNDFMNMQYNCFILWMKENNLNIIHVRNPATCKDSINHNLCRKCCGYLPENITNVGIFSTLMVTENVTQSALSSMNKGKKVSINDALKEAYTGNISNVNEWIYGICDSIINPNVESRFYEIILLSRIKKVNNEYTVISLQNSMMVTDDLLGIFIKAPNMTNYTNMIHKGTFEDNSIKSMIAFNEYK